jgi:acyl-CoA synthetase (NDP forming)
MPKPSLDPLFYPRSIAVIGASRNPKKFGHIVLANLLKSWKSGKVFPVNPEADQILGETCYPKVGEIPEPVDLAVIAIPAPAVPAAIADCVKKKVRAAVILSAGFSEMGRKDLEEKMLKEAKGKLRIVGPNVLGILDSHTGLDTIFNPHHRQARPGPGKIAFVSQSGAFGAAVLDWATTQGIGISKFVSIGNRIDVDEVELLDYLAKDPQTSAISLYLEGTRRGKDLFKSFQSASRRKPIVCLKAGRTAAGAHAVMSHTASLAGEIEAWRAVFRQTGVLEAQTVEDLFDWPKALVDQPLPKITSAKSASNSYNSEPKASNSKMTTDRMSGAIHAGDRILVVTNGGGFGVMTSDELLENGLKLAEISKKTVAAIKKSKVLPPHATIANPIDLTGDSTAEMYKVVLENALPDGGVDAAIIIALFQVPHIEPKVVDVLRDSQRFKKPILVCATGGEFANINRKLLEQAGIPTYPTPTRAVRAMKAMVDYAKL